MALGITYNGKEAYLKAIPTTINEYYIDEVKKINTFIIYSIFIDNELVFRDGFEIEINPDLSIFEQTYNYLKENYFTNYQNI